MLRKLTWEHQAYSGLNASAAHGLSLAHLAELGCFHCNVVKSIGDEIVDNRNALLRDAGLWMNLLQNSSNVALERHWGATFAHGLWLGGFHNLLRHGVK